MFRLSPLYQSSLTAIATNPLRRILQGKLLFGLIAVCLAVVSPAIADDLPPAPRNATPYVRPTQYHLLPPAKPRQLERVPTVEDLVPVLDDTPIMSLMSGPVQSAVASASSGQDDWPYQEAAYGRDTFRNIAKMPETIGAFRPARVPPKYAETWRPEYLVTDSVANESFEGSSSSQGGLSTTLFQAIKSPFVTAPATQSIRQVDHAAYVPVPDPLTTTPSVLPHQSSSQSYVADMQSMPNPSAMHAEGCECEFCRQRFIQNSGILAGSRPTAIVSHRETTFRLDALVWWSNSSSLPALATTSAAGTEFDAAGSLSSPATTSIFSDHAFAEAAPGYRFQIDHDFQGFGGIDFEFLQLGTRSDTLNASSIDFPILARPFTELLTGNQSANVIAFPLQQTGAIQVALDSRFRTAAAHYYQLAMEEGSRSIDDQLVAKFLIGPRIASLQESLWARDRSMDLISGSLLQRTDSLRTENLFVGGEIGMLLNRRFRYVDLSAGLSLAMGANRQKFRGSGTSIVTDFAGLTTATDSGWLTSSVGARQVNRNRFSVMPAAEFGIGFETQWGWRLSFEYDIMLWTNALRVTEQLDSGLDTTFGTTPGAAFRPFPSLKNDSYLAHGVSIGIERRW